MELFGCEQGETIGKAEPHLIAKDAYRSRSGTVVLSYSLRQYAAEQVLILFHRVIVLFNGSSYLSAMWVVLILHSLG